MYFTILFATFAVTSLARGSFIRDLVGQPNDVPPPDKSLDSDWTDYKLSYNKTYDSSSYESYRRLVWEDNLAEVNNHNKEAAMGLHSYWMGVNQFTDMTEEEFSRLMLPKVRPPRTNVTSEVNDDVWVILPSSVDWRKKSVVTGVKNQGRCGSCWAFSATGAIEGQHAKKKGKLVSLSEQELVDCSGRFGNRGCKGGFPYKAYEYVMANRGLDTEQCYPYKGQQGTCRAKRSCIGATVRSYAHVPEGENHLQKAVAEVGPISVVVMVSSKLMKYKSGVFYDDTCARKSLGLHAILAVGYESGYWIIKNSWGARWGMAGYIQWARNKQNMCGVASDASYPIV